MLHILLLFAVCVNGYGADCSFPVHHQDSWSCDNNKSENNSETLNQYFKNRYDEFINGCYALHGDSACNSKERQRIKQNVQVPAMTSNVTRHGYKIIQSVAPEIKTTLTDYWLHHIKLQHSLLEEPWPKGNTVVNHWEAPTYLVNVTRKSTVKFQSTLQATLEMWLGDVNADSQKQQKHDFKYYGIRVYTRNTIIAPHVNSDLKYPVTGIYIVDQDLEQDWPIEIYLRSNGKAYNVTVQPGQMVFLESNSIIHGNPFPLQGKYVAVMYFHFPYKKPPTPKENYNNDQASDTTTSSSSTASSETTKKEKPTMPVHHAAATGNLRVLHQYYEFNQDYATRLTTPDANGWYAIHEAARGGHVDALQFLVETVGADVNVRTNFGTGDSPLALAFEVFGEASTKIHPAIKYLQSQRAQVYTR